MPAVHEAHGSLFRVEVGQLGELDFYAGDVVVENFLGEKLAPGGFPAGIANRTRCAARDCYWMMAGQLKTSQCKQRHEIANVQTVRRRIEAAVKRDGRGVWSVPPCRCNRQQGRAISVHRECSRAEINSPQSRSKLFSLSR